MYCKKCGTQNDDNAYACSQCGQILQQAAGAGPLRQSIPNYLVQSILVTLFCCLPFGIVAIVFAAQVNGRVQAGDLQGALHASNTAKMWCWVSFGLGLTGAVLYLLLGVLAAVSSQ